MWSIIFVNIFILFMLGYISLVYTHPPLTPRSHAKVHFEPSISGKLKKITRFWTNTGFCPPAPTNHTKVITDFMLSHDVRINLELISALPNHRSGIQTIRIHWLINLIRIKYVSISYLFLLGIHNVYESSFLFFLIE